MAPGPDETLPAFGAPAAAGGLQAPAAFGHYKVIDRLGHGGMGVVYRARHDTTGQVVALKTVVLASEHRLASVRREIHALAGVRHPGIVRIVEAGVTRGLPWYAMELLEGTSLAALTTPGPVSDEPTAVAAGNDTGRWWTRTLQALPGFQGGYAPSSGEAGRASPAPSPAAAQPAVVAHARPALALPALTQLMRRVCEALAYLHGEGLVHRDLKPDNILVREDGQPVIVDFGLATRFAGPVSRDALTIEGALAGTVNYMAPEQLRGELVDARADLYALGCILYQLLTGRVPFAGATVAEVAHGHLSTPLVPPSRLTALPGELDALVCRLLEKDPRARLGYAEDVARVLGRLGGGGAAGTGSRAYLYRPRLIGRERELGQLVARLGGDGALVLLDGESGVGKTRLAVELTREATWRGLPILSGECRDAGGALQGLLRPLEAIADRCRELGPAEIERVLGRGAAVLATVQPALAALPGAEGRPVPAELPAAAARIRLFTALRQALAAMGAAAPALLIIDDLQWADDLLLGFLRWLVGEGGLAERPLVVIGTVRSEERSPAVERLAACAGVVTIPVPRLQDAAVARLIADMLALAVAPAALCAALARQSEGNPFFVAEYLLAAVDEGLLARDHDGVWQLAGRSVEAEWPVLPLPGSLRALVERRLGLLPAAAAELAIAAAIVGRESPRELLAAMLGGDLLGAETELVRRGVLEDGGDAARLRFSHDKLREVVLERLAPEVRADWHRRAALALASSSAPDPLALARHWEAAGHPDQARLHYMEAAEAELATGAYAGAAAAARAARRLGAPVRALMVIARALAAQGEHAEVQAVAAELAGAPDATPDQRARGRLFAAAAHEARDQYDAALAIVDELAADPQLASEALAVRAQVWFRRGRYAEALAAVAEAGRRLTGEGREVQTLRARLATISGNAHAYLDDYPSALAAYQQAVEISRALGDRWGIAEALNQLASTVNYCGRAAEAWPAHREALAIRRAIGDRLGIARSLGNLGILEMERGGYAEAESLLAEALGTFRELGARLAVGMSHDNLGWTKLQRGEPARQHLETALAIARDIGAPFLEVEALAHLGELTALAGDAGGAARCYDESLALAEARGLKWAIGAALLGRAEVLAERSPAAARTDAARALALWQELGIPRYAGLAHGLVARFQAEAGEPDVATELARGHAELDRDPHFALVLRFMEAEAMALSAAGDVAGARARAEEADALAREHGALGVLPRIDRLRARLRAG